MPLRLRKSQRMSLPLVGQSWALLAGLVKSSGLQQRMRMSRLLRLRGWRCASPVKGARRDVRAWTLAGLVK